jgi:antitoxin MazE
MDGIERDVHIQAVASDGTLGVTHRPPAAALTAVALGLEAILGRQQVPSWAGDLRLGVLACRISPSYNVSTRISVGGMMKLQVAKWGNSLAIRLPVECLRAAGLKEGDEVEAEVTPSGEIRLTVAQSIDKKAFLERVARLRAGLPMTTATVEEMRRDDRY